MLSIQDLHKAFGDVVALDGCSFGVARGTMLGFLGPNGAGKTTAMRSVFGLMRPDSGEVTWDGQSIGLEQRKQFGYMPEQRGLY
ncbi:MAG: ATP-binding cassette domain-containing protein, partial [Actinomycetota bacterium]|nr:ATP-binding cassette domain-containing protein [Actinomycetota bacterium]